VVVAQRFINFFTEMQRFMIMRCWVSVIYDIKTSLDKLAHESAPPPTGDGEAEPAP